MVAEAGRSGGVELAHCRYCFRSEHVRVRVGQLIGTLATLEHNSIGQGKQSGLHLFGLHTKTLISAVNQAFQGVPLFPPLPDLCSLFFFFLSRCM